MINMDMVKISIPNQKLIKMEIKNYGKKETIRRKVSVKLSYDLSFGDVERILLEAAYKTKFILDFPKSFVRITNFGNYGNEYSLFVFFNEVKRMNHIMGELNHNIFEVCRNNNIGLSTPALTRILSTYSD